jgi:CheY-like chemotaxis protein
MRALIADDDAVVRTILSAILESLQVEVDITASGQECLQHLRAVKDRPDKHPQVIFLDMLLQDMTGLEVAAAIDSLFDSEAKPPIVMLSANTQQEIMDRGGPAVPDYFLEKPFTSQTIAVLLRDTLGFKIEN